MDKSKEQDICIQMLISEIVTLIVKIKHISIEDAYKLFYKTNLSKKIEDIETGYYLEGAGYIYELIDKELNAT